MAQDTLKPAAKPRSTFPYLLAGIILGCLGLSWFAHRATHGVWNEIAQYATGRKLIVSNQGPAVISSIQRLQRLETVSYSMDKIVESAKESDYLPDFLAGDRLLLVVHGQVLAGVDLGKLQTSNVSTTEHSVHVHLPDPEIFVVNLDNAGTHVYSRTTGLLVPEDANLETETRMKATEQIRQAALDGGILNKARDNAKATITTMLQGMGFQQITVD
jgi:hypothetical protein